MSTPNESTVLWILNNFPNLMSVNDGYLHNPFYVAVINNNVNSKKIIMKMLEFDCVCDYLTGRGGPVDKLGITLNNVSQFYKIFIYMVNLY
jgi:hypothetical protein